MEKKTDRRTLYTKKVIRESLIDLMHKKPFPKITVKELCELAEINKGTFYLHYQDLRGVLEELEDEIISSVETELPLTFDPEAKNAETIAGMLSKLSGNPVLTLLLTKQAAYSEIIDKFAGISAERSGILYAERYRLSKTEADALSTFIIYGSIAVSRNKLSASKTAKWDAADRIVNNFIQQGFSALTKR